MCCCLPRISVWFPSIQLNCKLSDSKTGKSIWKSIHVSNFVTPPHDGLDKRSCKADEFSFTYKSKPGSDFPESYTVAANFGKDLQVTLEITRPAAIPGWKIGAGEKGGFSYFGHDPAKPDGYVVHRFWPHYKASGVVLTNGTAVPINGVGLFIHAIQGMRPDLVATLWNFADFQSTERGGVSAIQMEFTTTDTHGKAGPHSGRVKVNIGSLVVGGKLVSVMAETTYAGDDTKGDVVCKASHHNVAKDPETGYMVPSQLTFDWAGPSLIGEGSYTGALTVDVGDSANPKGLIEKVDVLGEIPTLLKSAVNYVTGTKPYIYQVSLSQLPSDLGLIISSGSILSS